MHVNAKRKIETAFVPTQDQRDRAQAWFKTLRDDICALFEEIEREYAGQRGGEPGKFERETWQREEGGGGVMSVMRGQVFEKVGVNVSTVFGDFDPSFAKDIPGAIEDPAFWASGVSLVSHMCSPLVPATHMNTRHIVTTKSWFGGGADLTPYYINDGDTQTFHDAMKAACDAHDPAFYPDYKKWCDEYFYLPHRKEPRGVGGIFYDYHNTDDWEADFAFTQDVGRHFASGYGEIVRRHMFESWTPEQRHHQLVRRGRYVEYNLLYDRGTLFGLKTNGHTPAILMSMPPAVLWP